MIFTQSSLVMFFTSFLKRLLEDYNFLQNIEKHEEIWIIDTSLGSGFLEKLSLMRQ